MTIVYEPTALPDADLGTALTPVEEADPLAEPLACLYTIFKETEEEEPVPELLAVNCQIGAPK
jgi:hypothetical protein